MANERSEALKRIQEDNRKRAAEGEKVEWVMDEVYKITDRWSLVIIHRMRLLTILILSTDEDSEFYRITVNSHYICHKLKDQSGKIDGIFQ